MSLIVDAVTVRWFFHEHVLRSIQSYGLLSQVNEQKKIEQEGNERYFHGDKVITCENLATSSFVAAMISNDCIVGISVE